MNNTTPGPWFLRKHDGKTSICTDIDTRTGKRMPAACYICHIAPALGEPEVGANARLIVKAPELLEMLELITAEAEDFLEKYGEEITWVKKARSLINEATGDCQ